MLGHFLIKLTTSQLLNQQVTSIVLLTAGNE